MWRSLGHLDTDERYNDLQDLFSVSRSTIKRWTQDARDEEKREKQDKAWDMWLDCYSQGEIADTVNVTQQTVSNWLTKKGQMGQFCKAPSSLQTFDVWSFGKADESAGGKILGRMPAQVMENLIWTVSSLPCYHQTSLNLARPATPSLHVDTFIAGQAMSPHHIYMD